MSKGYTSSMAYLKRVFFTENQGILELIFPEFLDSKRVRLKSDIVTYGCDNPETKFDLMIGTKTMSRLGIILEFKAEMVTLDKQTSPMLDIRCLRDRNQMYNILYSRFNETNIMFNTEPTL